MRIGLRNGHVGLERRLPALVLYLVLLSAPSGVTAGEPLALVVHPQVEVEELSEDELRRIFLGDQQYWPGRRRITLLIAAPETPVRSMVLDQVYGMSEQEYRKYWIGKMFRAEVASGPRMAGSDERALSMVAAIPGAVTFVPLSKVGGQAKVVRINGQMPGEEGYGFSM